MDPVPGLARCYANGPSAVVHFGAEYGMKASTVLTSALRSDICTTAAVY